MGKNDSHIFCARPCHFSLPGWRHGSPGNHAHLHRRRHAQICKYYTHCYPSIFASLTTCAVAMKNALFRALKISEFGKWVERHNGDHVISDDVTGARDEKRRIGNTVMSTGMSKSVNTIFFSKVVLAVYREPTQRSDSSNLNWRYKDSVCQVSLWHSWVFCVRGAV